MQSVVVGKAWWLEKEAAGHMASTVREQKEIDAGAQPVVPFYSLSSSWDGVTQSRVGLSISIKPIFL